LPEADVSALADIVERLVDAYTPERIYLFGSKARGDAGPDSDFDLLTAGTALFRSGSTSCLGSCRRFARAARVPGRPRRSRAPCSIVCPAHARKQRGRGQTPYISPFAYEVLVHD